MGKVVGDAAISVSFVMTNPDERLVKFQTIPANQMRTVIKQTYFGVSRSIHRKTKNQNPPRGVINASDLKHAADMPPYFF